jgi:penicillin-binding protein 1A
MSDWSYSDEELKNYFNDAGARSGGKRNPHGRLLAWWDRKLNDGQKAEAAAILTWMMAALVSFSLFLGIYFVSIIDELPPLTEIENPEFQLATIAYTADGRELARYARQNRSWVYYDDISPHVINALWATEDHRFYDHWGIDVFRTVVSVGKSVLAKLHIPGFDVQGGSTISQQLARNLYNSRIGKEQTVGRKMKEWVTAVQLERRYTKNEIIEMYLNTVEFPYNAYGIEAASRTFYGKDPLDLNELESATLVGMLKGITRYNPIRNPELARQRRNVVLSQMIKREVLAEEFLETHRADSVNAVYRSAAITQSVAPHFAEEVRKQLVRWAEANGHDIYDDGLIVYTTLDSRLQSMAQAAADSLMPCFEAVADFEWSEAGNDFRVWDTEPCSYLGLDKQRGFTPWKTFFQRYPQVFEGSITRTEHYRSHRRAGLSRDEAVAALKANAAFVDSLQTVVTRPEIGLVAIDPQTGFVKVWIGGRRLDNEWYDKVSMAERQPGSTFKPFLYTAAIDNGYSPYYTLLDDTLTYVDAAGNVWSPGNSGEEPSGQMMTLREALARSINTVSARLILEVGPSNVAFYARRMGITSPLAEYPSLALGVSDVKLLELTSAYATFANGGLLYEPTMIWRIEDRSGNVLYEANPAPREALSENTAYTMVDMLRGVIQYGTGQRINAQYRLGAYDLAGKTGTTQNSQDTWFMMMHPDLVMGSWIGFNNPSYRFRTDWWGQGAHTALHVVGSFMRQATSSGETFISRDARFPAPGRFGAPQPADSTGVQPPDDERRDGSRLDW